MDMSTKSEEGGASGDILDIQTEMEKFNETIEGQELDEEQSAFVENLTHMLDEVREWPRKATHLLT